jgi:hypothetical protein
MPQGAAIFIPVETNADQAATKLATLDKAIARVDKEVDPLIAELTKLRNTLKATSEPAQGFVNSFTAMKNSVQTFMGMAITQSIIRYARAFIEFADECINASERVDDLRKQLENMTGSADGTRQVMQQMRDVVSTGVFNNLNVEEATRQLILAGETTNTVGRTLNNLANYAAATGQGIDTVTSSFARMSTTGDVSWRAIRSFGTPVLQQLAKDLYGSETATNRVRTALGNGQITFNQFRTALDNLTNANGRFAESLASEARDADAAINRIGVAWGRLKALLGEKIFAPAVVDFDNFITHVQRSETVLGGYLNSLSDMARRYGVVGNAISRVIQLLNYQERLQQAAANAAQQNAGQFRTNLPAGLGQQLLTTQTENPQTTTGGGTGLSISEQRAIKEKQALIESQNLQKSNLMALESAERTSSAARLELAKQTWSGILNIAQTAISGIMNLQQMQASAEIQAVENDYTKKKKYITDNVKDEQERDKQLAALEKEKEAKIAKIKVKAARDQKALMLMNAIVSTAAGITNALAMSGPPWVGIAMAALIGSLGAIQVSIIANTEVPTAAFGGDFKVPPGYQADSGLLRVNSGEKVSVTPERGNDMSSQKMTLNVAGQDMEAYLEKAIGRILNSGSVSIKRQGVVKAA